MACPQNGSTMVFMGQNAPETGAKKAASVLQSFVHVDGRSRQLNRDTPV
jgi:hypothetical protein